MASQSQPESPRSILQRLITSQNRDLSLLFPFILGFHTSSPDPDVIRAETESDPDTNSVSRSDPDESIRRQRVLMFNSLAPPETDSNNNRVDSAETETDPDNNSVNRSNPVESIRRQRVFMFNSLARHETDPDNNRVESGETEADPDTNSVNRSNPDESTRRERIILFNPETQSAVVMEGIGLNSMFDSGDGKTGQPPATKSSVEELPCVEIRDDDDNDEKRECVICLEEFNVGNIIKKMPCQHLFHQKCIEKWLGIHGSCPVCRYKMPVDDDVQSKNGRVNSDIWVRVSFGRSE